LSDKSSLKYQWWSRNGRPDDASAFPWISCIPDRIRTEKSLEVERIPKKYHNYLGPKYLN
jgi:hypothetical protein